MEYKTHSPINQYLVGNLIREFAESATFFDNPYALEVSGESEHKFFDYNDAVGELKKEVSTYEIIQSLEICGQTVYWNGDSESADFNLLQFVAWKVFKELGAGDSFICKEIHN